jgi:hypothetical protein
LNLNVCEAERLGAVVQRDFGQILTQRLRNSDGKLADFLDRRRVTLPLSLRLCRSE